MKIVIAGAGDVGFHLAALLVYENKDIVLIDTDAEILDYAATHLDVLTLTGDATSLQILEQAQVRGANLFLAVTTFEQTNLIAAILAKKMGAKQTIARIQNTEFLEENAKQVFRELGVDTLISPRKLAADEIYRLVKQCSFTDLFEFERGKISLVGITLDQYSPLVDKKMSNLLLAGSANMPRPIAVLRGHSTLIPRGDTILRANDHIYFITRKEHIPEVERIVGKKQVTVKRIMIIGGTDMAIATAQRLEQEYEVILIERKKERCQMISDRTDKTLVVCGDFSNVELLKEEGLAHMDAFIALTNNAETNIIASLTAKNNGVYKTIAQVENTEYIHISQNIGVDTLINRKLIAANNIFRFVRKGRVEAITTLHGVDAEIIEFVVHKDNQLTRKPLKDLPFPNTSLVGGVIRGEESLIPNGDFQLQKNDKVIVFALPNAISRVEKLFR